MVDQNLYLLKDVGSIGAGDALQTRNVSKTFQLIGKTSSGTGSAVVDVEFSNDPTKQNWVLAGTITISLGTSFSTDGFYSRSSWTYARGNVKTLTGTGAQVSLIIGY